ncbi:MAG: TetR/AcrR family transcriptional regulator [Solirubrobacteraceae bacterium]|nr:TetR/AcrR family transcriptional regulator [Solirubrobacteraceae bacterium]
MSSREQIRSGARRETRRREIAARLEQAVRELIAAGEPYATLSVERMMRQARLSRSTFYAYFADKSALLRYWGAQVHGEVRETAGGAWWLIGPGVTRDDVRRALTESVTIYVPHSPLMAIVSQAAAYDADLREQLDAEMIDHIAQLEAHIRSGQEGGWIDPTLLPAPTAGWLIRMAERVSDTVLVDVPPGAEMDAQIDAFTEIVWSTLYVLPDDAA